MATLTLTLQLLVTAGFFLFAACAWGVYRRMGEAGVQRAAWGLAAGVFTVHAADKLVMEIFGTSAFIARESWPDLMSAYVLAYPAFNHSRTFLLTAFSALLLYISVRPPAHFGPPFYRRAAVVLGTGLVVGALMGVGENGAVALTHFTRVAQWDVVELLVMLTALFAALVRNAVDRTLWFCIAIYAFSLSLNSLWFAAFARTQLPGEWSPNPWETQMYRLVLTSIMAAFAFQRLRQARRGVAVRGLLESARPQQPSMVG